MSRERDTHAEEIPLQDYLTVVLRKWWVVVSVFGVIVLLAVLLSVRAADTYQARARLLIVAPVSTSALIQEQAQGTSLSVDTLSALATANDLLEKIIASLEIQDSASGRLWSVDRLAGMLNPTVEKAGQGVNEFSLPLLTMTVRGGDPGLLKRIANKWADLFVQQNAELFAAESARSFDFILAQYEETSTSLNRFEEERAKYIADNPLPLLEDELELKRADLRLYLDVLLDDSVQLTLKSQDYAETVARLDELTLDGRWIGLQQADSNGRVEVQPTNPEQLAVVQARQQYFKLQEEVENFPQAKGLTLLRNRLANKQSLLSGYVSSLQATSSDLALKASKYNSVVAQLDEVTVDGKWVGLQVTGDSGSEPSLGTSVARQAAIQARQGLFEVQEEVENFPQAKGLTLLRNRLANKRTRLSGYVSSLEDTSSNLALKTSEYNEAVTRLSEVTVNGKWVGLQADAGGSSDSSSETSVARQAATQARQALFEIQERIETFQQSTELTLLNQRQSLKRGLLGGYLSQLEAAENNVKTLTRTLEALNTEIKTQPQFLVLVKAVPDVTLFQELGLNPTSAVWEQIREIGLQTEEVNPAYISLTDQIISARTSLETERERITLRTTRVDETRSEVKSLEKEVSDTAIQLDRLRIELALAQLAYEKQEQYFASLTTQEVDLRNATRGLQAKQVDYEKLVEEARIAVKVLEQEVAQKEGIELPRLRDELALREQAYDKERAYFAGLVIQDVSLRNAIRELQARQEVYEELLEEARQDVQGLEQRVVQKEKIELPRLQVELAFIEQIYGKEQSLFNSLQTGAFDLRNSIRRLQVEREEYQKLVDTYGEDVNTISARITFVNFEVQQFDRQIQTLEDTLYYLSLRLQDARMAKEEQEGFIRIVERAVEPQSPVGPNKRQNVLIGATLGLVLGVGGAFVVHYIRP